MLSSLPGQFGAIESRVDSGVNQRAGNKAKSETLPSAGRRQIHRQTDGHRRAGDDATRVIRGSRVTFLKPAQKWRGRIGAFNDRPAEREKERAERCGSKGPCRRDQTRQRRE